MCHTMTLFRITTCTDYDIRAPKSGTLPRQWPRRFPTQSCSSCPRSRSRWRACKKDPAPFGQPFAVDCATLSQGSLHAQTDCGCRTCDRGRSEVCQDTNGPDLPLARCPCAALQRPPSRRSRHCAAFLFAKGLLSGTFGHKDIACTQADSYRRLQYDCF
jgi:hypothetical protein